MSISRVVTPIPALALAASLLFASTSASAIELVSGLGGVAGFGTGILEYNDDGSSAVIPVSGSFPAGLRFFGMTFSSMYVNNNGNVSFGGPLATYTPDPFPISNQRMIAPWWGDVDTRGTGRPLRNGVYWALQPGRAVITWHNVGYYSSHDNLANNFQLLLTAAGPGVGDFDVELRYNRCEWTTGDASMGSGGFGGIPAQAGFDAGNLRDFVTLPGSRTMDVLRLCVTSNVGVPGLWRFTIRGGEVMCPGMGTPCVTTLPGVCSPGIVTCRGTTPVCTSRVMSSPEVCDGLDNDCDSLVDDNLGPRPCYTGPAATRTVGACREGAQTCAGGRYGLCVGETTPRPEACNNVDDDCNGLADDIPGSQICGVGACRRVASNCLGGMVPPCVPGAPVMETCNGLDDDCDGTIDNNACPIEPGPEAGVVDTGPEAGVVDVSTDDAGSCHDYTCDPSLRLTGRAGPIGNCGCRVAAPRRADASLLASMAVAAAVLVRRRRSRASNQSR